MPRSMSAMERNPEVPASTPYEDHSPGRECRGIPRVLSRLTWRLDLLRPHEWVPEVLLFCFKATLLVVNGDDDWVV